MRSRARLFSALALATALCGFTPTAAAEPLPLQLEWSAPPGCPTGEQVERELLRITRARADRALQLLVVRGLITERPDGFHLALDLSKNGTLRQSHFDSPTCAPLRQVATLVIALAYGDGAELARESPGAASESPVPTSERVAPPNSSVPTRPRSTAWLAALVSSGLVGPVGGGGEAGMTLGGGFWAAFARAGALPPVTAAVRDGVSAQLSALTAGVGACGRLRWRSASIDGCLELDAALVQARSSGAARDGAVTAPWYGLGPGLVLFLPLVPPVTLRAELGVRTALTAARYDVEPRGTIYAAPRFTPHGSLGLGLEL